MLNFTHRLLLGLLMFLTASCAKIIPYEDVKSKKYGVLVARAVFYEQKYNFATMYFESYLNGKSTHYDHVSNKFTKHRDVLKKEKGNSAELLDDYHYSVVFAEPGKYDIRRFYSFIFGSMMNLKLNKTHLCFNVKPGEINYIGDIYIKKGEQVPTGFFEDEKFRSGILAQERSEEARNFMKKYYPEFDLPFNSSLLTMDNCENS